MLLKNKITSMNLIVYQNNIEYIELYKRYDKKIINTLNN